MAYDERLAERIRTAIGRRTGITEKRMFGGLAFLRNGKMFVGIVASDLMARVGPDAYDAALAKKHVRPMDFTGKPLTGYVYVAAAGTKTVAAVKSWVESAAAYVDTIEKKPAKKRAKQKRTPPTRRK